MKISVATVCYNAADNIASAVRSFLAQDHEDKELLVVDGGSRDTTVAIVESFRTPQIRVISEPDNGIYDAMNKALCNFSGDAVGFLNADDTFHDDGALSRIAAALENADAAHGDLQMVRDHAAKQVVREWKAGPFTPGAFRNGWMPPHPTFYIRRTLAEKTGLFDTSYRIAADYDFMLRSLELQGARSAYIPYVQTDFMIGGISTKGPMAVARANFECLRIRQKHLGAPMVDMALFAKPLRKLRQLRLG